VSRGARRGPVQTVCACACSGTSTETYIPFYYAHTYCAIYARSISIIDIDHIYDVDVVRPAPGSWKAVPGHFCGRLFS